MEWRWRDDRLGKRGRRSEVICTCQKQIEKKKREQKESEKKDSPNGWYAKKRRGCHAKRMIFIEWEKMGRQAGGKKRREANSIPFLGSEAGRMSE